MLYPKLFLIFSKFDHLIDLLFVWDYRKNNPKIIHSDLNSEKLLD